MTKVLVTGAAGFVGLYVSKLLLARGDEVIGLDNLNSYYDPRLKDARLTQLQGKPGFSFIRLDLADRDGIAALFERERPELVVHLGAQAGVRYSLDNPAAYVDSNLVGFGNVLEGCRRNGVRHLVYASSSSVYGANTKVPFSVHDNVDHPISFYAATKKANELMAHSYSHLYGLPVTGLRFFTVYGPWGRPDMAYFSFTKAILEGTPIDVYNHGRSKRDFTYIDDIAEGVVRCLDLIPTADPEWDSLAADPGTSSAPYRVYNIGNNNPVELGYFIEVIERATGREAVKRFTDAQPGDVPATFADISDLEAAIDFRPRTSIEEGIARFVAWYREFYGG
jgi:UDP-glucuronate 4-epimerase